MEPRPDLLRQTDDIRRCRAAACFGFDQSSATLRSIYLGLVELYAEVGVPADRLAVRAFGFGEHPLRFSRAHSRLAASDWKGFQCCELYSLLPGGTIPNEHWQLRTILSVMKNESFGTYALSELLPEGDLVQTETWRTAVASARPAYGFSFACRRQQGSEYYVAGLKLTIRAVESQRVRDLERRVGRWSDSENRQPWTRGILRDIYPQNLLTAPHLGYRVGETSFADWVAASADRGRLSDYAGGMTLWEVDDAQREEVGPALLRAGMLFNPYDESWETFRVMFPEP